MTPSLTMPRKLTGVLEHQLEHGVACARVGGAGVVGNGSTAGTELPIPAEGMPYGRWVRGGLLTPSPELRRGGEPAAPAPTSLPASPVATAQDDEAEPSLFFVDRVGDRGRPLGVSNTSQPHMVVAPDSPIQVVAQPQQMAFVAVGGAPAPSDGSDSDSDEEEEDDEDDDDDLDEVEEEYGRWDRDPMQEDVDTEEEEAAQDDYIAVRGTVGGTINVAGDTSEEVC